MKLEQSFEVDAPLERVWQTLIDVEHVAPCLPGAAVTGRNEDGSYNGTFTVKIGPTTASYTGRLEMENIDEASHTATMQAQGTDKRGQGGAKATIYSRLAPADGRGTRVEVVTDYHITGRLARFGRGGMIEDISERLLREFAKRLQSSLASQQEAYAAPAQAPAAWSEPERHWATESQPPAAQPVSPAEAAPAGYSEAAPAAGYSEAASAAAPSDEPETATYHTAFTSVPGAGEAAPPEAPVSPAAEEPAAEPSRDELPPAVWPPRREEAPPVEAAPAAEAPPAFEHAEPSTPPEAPVSPAPDVVTPPPPAAPAAGEPAPEIPSAAEPGIVPAPADPASGPPPAAEVGEPAGPGAAPEPSPEPMPEAVPATGPEPIGAGPGAPPGEPGAHHLPQPSEPMQGLSLVGGVLWNRVKRNPAPAAAAGVAVMLLLARRRRKRSAWG